MSRKNTVSMGHQCFKVYDVLSRCGWAPFKVDTLRLKDGRVATRFLASSYPQNLQGVKPLSQADLKSEILARLGTYAFVSEVRYRYSPEICHVAIYVTVK